MIKVTTKKELDKKTAELLSELVNHEYEKYRKLIEKILAINFYLPVVYGKSVKVPQKMLDEILFDNTKISLNEIILALILPIVWLIIKKRNAGKNIGYGHRRTGRLGCGSRVAARNENRARRRDRRVSF